MTRVHEKVDVVIVGAGAAGSYLARRLAESGKAVVVLEAGPAWTMTDLISSQIYARRLRWGGAAVETVGEHPYGYVFNAGWGLGGAALHHYGTWPRLHEEDFRVKSLYGRGLDWPFDYETLQPYYDRIQAEAGLSGDAEAELWRPPGDPYPMGPLKTFGQARAIARGFAALGMRTAPMPMAITSDWYDGRPPCIYDGWCDAGCPIGALYNPLVRDLPGVVAAGADIRTRATVTRLQASKRRVEAVDYIDREGRPHCQSADRVVLAASVVHNPAILLNSANAHHPDGLANASGLVGRYFMTHSVAGIFALFDGEETEPHKGVSGAQLSCRDGYAKDRRESGFGSYQWLIGPAVKPNDLLGIAVSRADLFGPALDAFLKRAVKHLGNMLAMGEDLPKPENRIELGERTALGVRRPRIVHRFDADGLAVREHARLEGLEIMKAAGAAEAWAGPLASAHNMGGTIMGDDPQTSVTDAFGRAHELDNLFIAGPGLFPTAGAINPTFTVYALAARQADHMLAGSNAGD